MADVPKLLYDLREVSFATARSRSALYRDMGVGLLEYLEVGSRRRVTAEALDRYVERLKAGCATAA